MTNPRPLPNFAKQNVEDARGEISRSLDDIEKALNCSSIERAAIPLGRSVIKIHRAIGYLDQVKQNAQTAATVGRS